MSDLDIAKITKDALGYSLPQFQEQTQMAPESPLLKDMHDGSTTPRNFSKAAASTATDLINPTVDVHDPSPAVDDCEMTGMGADVVASPDVRNDAANPPLLPHSPARYASARRSVLQIGRYPQATGRLQLQPRGPATEFEFELCEVVVHRTEIDSSPPQRVQHQLSLGSGDDSVASAPQKPLVAAVTARSAKTIRALAPQRRGSAAAKASTSAVPRPAQTAGIEAFDAIAQQDSFQSGSKSIPCSDSSGATSIPQPPPRSRSRSRIRQTSGVDAVISAASGDGLNELSLVSAPNSIEGYAGRGQASEMTIARPRDVMALPVSAFANPTEQTDLLLHARPRDTTSFGTVSVAAPSEPTARQVPAVSAPAAPSRAGVGVAASSLPARDTHQDKTSAALSGRRPAKSASTKRQSTRNGAAAVSWEERVKISKEKFGDQVEEC